jgi:hypothetical protein
MPGVTYYLRRVRELGLGESIQQAQALIWTHVAAAAGRAYDGYLRRPVRDSDILRLSGFSARSACAAHFKSRVEPSFFSGCDPDRRPEQFRSTFPREADEILAAAERLLRHEISLLGSGPTNLDDIAAQKHKIIQADGTLSHGKPPVTYLPWHTDFKSLVTWHNRTYYRNIRYGHVPGADVKVPWELSRGHHLITLGQAYYLTSDERYATECVREISDWIENNPCRYGVNWSCTMDVGIRAVNWIWAFQFVRRSHIVDEQFVMKFLTFLLAHAKFIEGNLEFRRAWIRGEYRRLNSNHYLSDIVGLLYIALMFPEFRLQEQLRFATSEFETELFEQTTADGVDYEHSTSYHRLVLEIFLSGFSLLKVNGYQISPAIEDRLVKMASFTADYVRPDGSAPQIGDADDGRLHRLTPGRPTNDRYLPLVAAHLFSTSALQVADTDPELWWWVGPHALHNARPRISRSYASRFFIMQSDAAHVFISASEIGMHGLGSHSHNDILSFEYWARGCAWIVDPGTYVYTPDPLARNHFRSTAAHNTVRIDETEINPFPPGQLFQVSDIAKVSLHNWQAGDPIEVLDVEHDGYMRLPDGVTHRRTYKFERETGRLEVVDHFDGRGTHSFEWFFHIGTDIRASGQQNTVFMRHATDVLTLTFNTSLHQAACDVVYDWYSPSYGVRDRAQVIRASMKATVPVSMRFTLQFQGAASSEC